MKSNTAPALKWTHADTRAAMREGWVLSQVDNRADLVEIQRCDEDPRERFKTDAEAFAHVKRFAAMGAAPHVKALSLCRGVCMECGERERVGEVAGVAFSNIAASLRVCAQCVNAAAVL